jgi:hypothetical protein
MSEDATITMWWAKGLLVENCNCQIVCPGHVHFTQECTHDRCVGYWAMRVTEGMYEQISLDDVKAIVAFTSPKRMSDGGWTQRVIIDDSASGGQRQSIETILRGRAGGPWAVLAKFVETHLPAQFLPIQFAADGPSWRVSIAGVLTTSVEPIRGRDRSQVVTFENMFNQIHAASQVICRGTTEYDDGDLIINTEGTHGLYSRFTWKP